MLLSCLIPNISILITFSGALLGTIFNIWLPVLFYNRAYNSSEKNEALNTPQHDPDSENSSGRKWIKTLSWITFVVGTIIGIYSFIYVIIVFKDQGPDEI